MANKFVLIMVILALSMTMMSCQKKSKGEKIDKSDKKEKNKEEMDITDYVEPAKNDDIKALEQIRDNKANGIEDEVDQHGNIMTPEQKKKNDLIDIEYNKYIIQMEKLDKKYKKIQDEKAKNTGKSTKALMGMMKKEIEDLNIKKEKVHTDYLKKYNEIYDIPIKEQKSQMKQIRDEKIMNNLKHVVGDRTVHMLVLPEETRLFIENIKETPELIKIHYFLFGEQSKKKGDKPIASIQVTSPTGEVILNESTSIGFVVEFHAQIKGEYHIELTNLLKTRMRIQVTQQMDENNKGRVGQMNNREQFVKDIQVKVNNLSSNQTKEIAKLKQYTIIYKALTQVEESLFSVSKEDDVFEDTFNFFMEELSDSSKLFKKYTLIECILLVIFTSIQILFVRHLLKNKISTL